MRWLQAILLAGWLAPSLAQTIDKNCMACDRVALDSANLKIHPIRVNQVGYRSDDPHKRALVGDPKGGAFRVIRPNGTVAFAGNLTPLGTFPYKGRIMIKGYYNSIRMLKPYPISNTNDTDSASSAKESISAADFGALTDSGTYQVVVGTDTSLPFDIRPTIYNDIFETSLKYFGIERSGDDPSQMHAPSHLMDGSGRPGGAAVAGSLKGGWYDCGDYFKVGQTDAYAFTNLILAYTLWPQKAEDRYGDSYNDTLPFGNDGIPDLLREAKVGADYIMRLYRASREDGLLERNDMYQEVGVSDFDHQLWDQPERQDMAPIEKGGPPRVVDKGAGSAVAAQFAGSLALFAKAWYPFDPAYSDSILAAAKDIYKRVVIPNWESPGFAPSKYYIVQTRWDDDLAWAATGLWYGTGDTSYKFDLMGNTTYGNYPGAIINPSQKEFFWAGFLSSKHTNGNLFSPGGWVMDYQNTFVHSIWMLWDKMYRNDSIAARWGIAPAEAKDVRERILKLVGTRYVHESTNSPDANKLYPGTNVNTMKPYNLVWSSVTWGMNRYNMGGLLPVVLYHEMIKDDSAASARNYWNIILDNMNYNLGGNPWDISFLMGAGSKNLQHPHNRIANPEGYNAGGIPYKYRSPKGALMGGAIPGQLLRDEWEKFDVTETCIDFSSQMIIPSQYLAKDLPPDTTGPVFSNVRAFPSDTFAIVNWQTDELSRDTLFYSLTPNGPVLGYLVSGLAKNKSATIPGLTPDTKYYFWFTGMDIYRNVSRDDNRGRDYDFTTTTTRPPPPRILDVKACNIRGHQATIFWWTDRPASSAVEYAVEGANFATTKIRVEGDDEGLPCRFHKVTLKGLQANTVYRYDVFSAPASADSSGLHFRFSTGQEFANYTVQIAAMDKNAGGAGADFYLWVANTTNKPYYGLDLRFYFSADAALASSLEVHSSDQIIFDVNGIASRTQSPHVSVGRAQPVAGMPGTWYLPIHIGDTLGVAASERFEMAIDSSNWRPVGWSAFTNAWSAVAHSSPVAFPGVDMTHLWHEVEPVQNMQQVYIDDPYIGGYYNGQHIFGYTPDGDLPQVPRTVGFAFDGPRPSPATSVKQDTFMVHFSGRAWGHPDVQLVQAQRDSPPFVPTSAIASRTDSVRFAQVVSDPQGTTDHEWAFWADRNTPLCGCAWQRYIVTVDTMKVPPRRLRLVWTPAGPVDGFVATRVPLVLSLLDSTGNPLDTTISVPLSTSSAGASLWISGAGGAAVASANLVHGRDTIWISDAAPETVSVAASVPIPGSTVVSASVTVRFAPAPPWPLVDSAWTVDADCDGRADSVAVRLSAPPDSGAVVRSVSAAVGGVVSNLAPPALLLSGRDIRFALASGTDGGATGTGVLALHVTTGGRDMQVLDTFPIADRVGPRMVSASVLERFAPGDDTVRVEFSEPVSPARAWPFSAAGATAPASVRSVRNLSPVLVEWVLVGSDFPAGAALSTAAPAGVTDLSGNPLSTCSGPISLVVRAKPDPMVSAAVLSAGFDGSASLLRVRFARAVRDQDLPDSLVIQWDGTFRAIHSAALVRSPLDSSVLEGTIAPASLSGTGSRPGGFGQVLFMKGAGASGRADSVPAADSVGPALRSAVLRVGTVWDTLVLRMSEPAAEGAAPLRDLLVRSGAVLAAASSRTTTDSVRWMLALPSGAVVPGDSLRLAGISAGAWRDRSGNDAAPAAPWVPVRVGDRAPSSAMALDGDGDGRVDRVVLAWASRPSQLHDFLLTWPDSTGRGRTYLVDSAQGTWDGGTLSIPVLWPFGATAGPGAGVQLDRYDDGTVDSLPFAVADGAAPVVVQARLGYASPSETQDTLVVRFSEPSIAHGPVLVRVQSANGVVTDVVGLIATQSPDGLWGYIRLDPANPLFTRFQKGDKVQAAPGASGISDQAGNLALATGHFEPIEFGRRPPRFGLSFEPGRTVQDGGPVPPGEPAVRVFVRAAGASVWTNLDGTPADLSVVRLGPKLTSNNPMDGEFHLFDNMGTHVVSRKLDDLRAAVENGTIPTDPSGQWEAWIAWDGRTPQGQVAASGVYAMRLLLRRPAEGGTGWDGGLNKVYRIGWIRRN